MYVEFSTILTNGPAQFRHNLDEGGHYSYRRRADEWNAIVDDFLARH